MQPMSSLPSSSSSSIISSSQQWGAQIHTLIPGRACPNWIQTRKLIPRPPHELKSIIKLISKNVNLQYFTTRNVHRPTPNPGKSLQILEDKYYKDLIRSPAPPQNFNSERWYSLHVVYVHQPRKQRRPLQADAFIDTAIVSITSRQSPSALLFCYQQM